jgi:hypothetical protein
MVNNSHQYQQSEQSSLNSDGQQFPPISANRPIISKQRWSIIPPISPKGTITLVGIIAHHCLEEIVPFGDIGGIY